ncbi:MAG: hypothetical protein ACXWAT_13965 [Methylobacter sp.]
MLKVHRQLSYAKAWGAVYPAAKSRICVYSGLEAPKLDNTDMTRSQAQAWE